MSSRPVSKVLWLILLGLCAAGCGKARQEKAVRERAQMLIGHLCRGDMDACVEYADPIYVCAQGSGKVKFTFGIMGTLLKLGRHTEETVRIDEVTLGPDSRTASVRMSLLTDGQWKPLDPSKWVRTDGKWYITF